MREVRLERLSRLDVRKEDTESEIKGGFKNEGGREIEFPGSKNPPRQSPEDKSNYNYKHGGTVSQTIGLMAWVSSCGQGGRGGRWHQEVLSCGRRSRHGTTSGHAPPHGDNWPCR